MKTIVYITYDGLADPLGQSQILPYLKKLVADYNYSVIIYSCEKKHSKSTVGNLKTELDQLKIEWNYIWYSKKPPVISTIFDLQKIYRLILRTLPAEREVIVHCRSYLPALIGLRLKRKYNYRYVFDMRGFWADERVEGGIWNSSNPLFAIIYNYFKSKEKSLLEEADHIISLTQSAVDEISSWHFNCKPEQFSVIPTCVDNNVFSLDNKVSKDVIRKKLGISSSSFVLVYLGSLGTWYDLDYMLRFFQKIQIRNKDSMFLFITKDPIQKILMKAEQFGLSKDHLFFLSAERNQVPEFLSAADWGISLIKSLFSKKASAPTKLAELISLRIPVVSNSNVGDVEKYYKNNDLGYLLKAYNEDDLNRAAEYVIQNRNKIPMANKFDNLFDLNNAVHKWHLIYSEL